MRLPSWWELRSLLSKALFPDRPSAATMEDWAAIHKKEKANRPFMYWIDHDLMLFFSRQKNRISRVKNWFMYRFIKAHKYNLVDTGLEPGYYENDKRMLHANFNILKEYVEIEQASMQYHWCDEPKTTSPRDAGLKHNAWECELRFSVDDCGEGDPRIGKLTPQAASAREIRKLYLWWMDDRPARKDPYDVYPSDDEPDTSNGVDGWMEQWSNRTDEQQEADRERFKNIRKLEEKYEADDTAMLIRLIRIRKNMWS